MLNQVGNPIRYDTLILLINLLKMKPQKNTMWDSLQDHAMYQRSLVLFPYPKLPSISKPSDEFAGFGSLGYKPLVGDTTTRPFVKAKVLRDQEVMSSSRSVHVSPKQHHRIDSKFTESQKIRFLGKTEDGKTDTVGSVRTYRDSHTQSSPMETTSQSVNNAMNRTYAKQAKLQELTRK